MSKKQIINEEFLKSIESEYVFSNIPINRLKHETNNINIKAELEKLRNKIEIIENCDLKNNSKKIVLSDGDFNNKIMIVGEGPGEKDEKVGRPFMGDSGELLNKMLSAINLKRENVYITNVINYRPPNDRRPTPSEIDRYSKFLIEHILIINPKILILMGSVAMEALIGKKEKISKQRGQWKEILLKNKTFLSLITFHPAFLLRQPDQKKYSWLDLKELKNKIDQLNIS